MLWTAFHNMKTLVAQLSLSLLLEHEGTEMSHQSDIFLLFLPRKDNWLHRV